MRSFESIVLSSDALTLYVGSVAGSTARAGRSPTALHVGHVGSGGTTVTPAVTARTRTCVQHSSGAKHFARFSNRATGDFRVSGGAVLEHKRE